VRLFVLARHGQSVLNVEGLVNGDPRRDRGLTEAGVAEANVLGLAVAGLELDLAVVSPFPRSLETAKAALGERPVPLEVDDDLGDIRIGDLEGKTLADYRAVPAHTDRDVPFPGGESLNDAAARYVRAFSRLLERDERATLVVSHEVPVRYALNAVRGSDQLDRPVHAIPNATPYLFDEAGLRRAVERMAVLARPSRPGGARTGP
jgi:broad specificity phosphatase PhoE